MAKWLLIMLGVGGYVGMWIVSAWAITKFWDEDAGTGAVIGMVWPILLIVLIFSRPWALVAWIVERMPKGGGRR